MFQSIVRIPVHFESEPYLWCYNFGIRTNSWSIKMEGVITGHVCANTAPRLAGRYVSYLLVSFYRFHTI